MLRDKHVGIFFSDPRSIHAALVLVCCAGIITIRDAGEGTEVQAEEHPALRVLSVPPLPSQQVIRHTGFLYQYEEETLPHQVQISPENNALNTLG